MAKHTDISWKQDHPGTLFNSSVQKTDRMLKQVQSHPDETTLEQVSNQVTHAENARINAEQYGKQLETFEQNVEQLNQMKQELQEVEEIVEE